MDNENFTLLTVLFLAQNKELMREIEPVLSFIEEHKDSLNLFKDILDKQTTDKQTTDNTTTNKQTAETPNQPSAQTAKPQNAKPQPEKKEERSPLQGIASDEILKEIRSYLSAQK